MISVGLTLFWRKGPAGWATLAALQLLLGAVILFSLGILSEYLLRILDETRHRPTFVVDWIIAARSQQTDEKTKTEGS